MKVFSVALILAVAIAATSPAQDLGIPDTVRIDGDTLRIGQSIPIGVAIANDTLLRAFNFGLVSNSVDGGFAKIDSLVFVNRFSNPQVMDLRIVVLRDTNGIAPDTTVASARVGPGYTPGPTGNDAVFELWMTGVTPGRMVIDSGFFPPGANFVMIPYIDNWLAYTPQFVRDTLIIVEGGLPPMLTLPNDDPRISAGFELEFNVTAESPENYPVEIDLVDFSLLEGGSQSPANTPTLTGDNPAQFAWLTTASDVGLWSAEIQACDSTGICVTGTLTIQVVANDSYLISFVQTETEDAPGTINIAHGNTDDDPEAELFLCSSGLLIGASATLYDLDQSLTFQQAWAYPQNFPLRDPVVCYLNDDPYLDVAVLQNQPMRLHALFGDGDNGFSSESLEIPSAGVFGATMGEFTDDQYLDYVYVGNNGVSMCAGSGSAPFTSPITFSIGGTATSVNSADFNGDGLDDLAVGSESGLRIYLSDGTGGFTLGDIYSQTYGSLDIEITNSGSDFNSDNHYDLCLATPSIGGTGSELVVYLGNGDGTFNQTVVRSVTGHVMANASGDFNNDGRLDIAYVNASGKYCALLFGDGDGSFTNELRFPIAKYNPTRIDCFDADYDGDLDIVVASTDVHVTASLFLLENQLDPEGFSAMPLEITAKDNAELTLSSPSGQVVNKVRSSIASGEYHRRNLNQNTVLDDGITVNSLESGTYSISAKPKPGAAKSIETFSLELTVGTTPYRFADGAAMAPEGYEFDLYPFGGSPVSPASGSYVYRPNPTFQWEGGGSFDFQLATDILFTNILLSTTVSGNYVASPTLDTSVATLYYWRIKPVGQAEYESLYPFNLAFVECIVRGNINHDPAGQIDISDLVYLIDYMFLQGPQPPNYDEGNVDGLGVIDISDLVFLVDYMFLSGPEPPPCP